VAWRKRPPGLEIRAFADVPPRFPHRAGGLLGFHISQPDIAGGKDSELTRPEPLILANRSPRIFIAGMRGWGWCESRHLLPNRTQSILISKLSENFLKTDFSLPRAL
jgi:hypothetical protein